MRALLVLVALFVLFISAYEYGRLLNARPQPMHLWRQGDCLALTLNYARDNGTFLEPEILARIADGRTTGKSAGELPLIYWAMGRLWSVIGPSEFAYRLFGLLLHAAGTFALFGAVRRITASDFWSVATALLFFTSPVVVYYGISFLPDVPAYDLALIGWYAMSCFAERRDHRLWYLAAACFGLATLLKVTAGMSLVALVALLLVATVRPRWLGAERRLLPDALPGWGAVGVVLAVVLAWYLHAEVYNELHGGRYTFNNLWPIWTMTPERIAEAWHFAADILVFQVFDTSVWLLMGLALAVLLAHARQVPRAAWSLIALLLIGSVAYVLLWFNALLFHDYYFINPQVTLLAVWVLFIWWLTRHRPAIARAGATRTALVLLVTYNLGYAANNSHMRHHEGPPLMPASLLPVYHERELGFWNLTGYGHLADLTTITPYLRSIGVRETDPVIFPDDESINASLYLMGQPGWTGFVGGLDSAGTYDLLIRNGATHLLFADPAWERRAFLRPYLRRSVGRYGAVRIFDLRGLDRLRTDTVRLAFIPGMEGPADRPADAFQATAAATPWSIEDLPLDTVDLASAELRIRAMVRGVPAGCDGVRLIYEERVDGRVVHYHIEPLRNGALALDLLVQPVWGPTRRTLRLANTTGLPFVLERPSIELINWRDRPRP
jgi:hypothetical protein